MQSSTCGEALKGLVIYGGYVETKSDSLVLVEVADFASNPETRANKKSPPENREAFCFYLLSGQTLHHTTHTTHTTHATHTTHIRHTATIILGRLVGDAGLCGEHQTGN